MLLLCPLSVDFSLLLPLTRLRPSNPPLAPSQFWCIDTSGWGLNVTINWPDWSSKEEGMPPVRYIYDTPFTPTSAPTISDAPSTSPNSPTFEPSPYPTSSPSFEPTMMPSAYSNTTLADLVPSFDQVLWSNYKILLQMGAVPVGEGSPRAPHAPHMHHICTTCTTPRPSALFEFIRSTHNSNLLSPSLSLSPRPPLTSHHNPSPPPLLPLSSPPPRPHHS